MRHRWIGVMAMGLLVSAIASASSWQAPRQTRAADRSVVADADADADRAALGRAVADAIRNDPVWKAPIRGNVTLANTAADLNGMADRTGAQAVAIRWRASDAALLADTDRRVGDDVIRKGAVRRGANDRRVGLVATISAPGSPPIKVPLDVTIAAAPPPAAEKEAYLFVYFTGDTVAGEKLRFAVSEGNDALHWKDLNAAQPILESALGTRGLRDPFIMRSAEGDRFFLLATDLSVGRTGWEGSTSRGSQHLEIWESTDLIHWGNQQHVKVNLPNAGMTWAPEATYDPTIGAYVVYWTSVLFKDAKRAVEDGNGPRILMSTTRDFRTFTTPMPWFKAADVPGLVPEKGMIDSTVLKEGDAYYRFTKATQARSCASPDIIGQRSRSLRATGDSGQWTVISRCIGRTAGTQEVEGPSAFVANKGDVSGFRYFVWVDNYGGIGYIPLATNSLEGDVRWTYPTNFRLPASPRHGSVLSITARERAAVVGKWGSAASFAKPALQKDVGIGDSWVVPPVLASGTRLPAPAGTRVRWTADGPGLRDDVVVNDGTGTAKMQLTGTLTLPGGESLAKSFAVQVLGSDARRLFVYARSPTGARDANQPVIARSVHLALGTDGKDPVPLNGNYGVLFASGVYKGVDQVAVRGVVDPSPFHFADGSLGIIATRIGLSSDDAGQPDGTLVFKADPDAPGDFTELGTIDLRTDGGVTTPGAVWDSAAKRYVVTWKDRSGVARWTTVEDLARTERIATRFSVTANGGRSRVASEGNVGVPRPGEVATVRGAGVPASLPGAEAVSVLPVTVPVATALADRFGRIVNTAAAIAARTIAAGDIGKLTNATVRLSYSDGSTATRRVDWNHRDIARLAGAGPGTYAVRGTVRQPAYPQIFAYNRADPAIFRFDRAGSSRYLFVATDDTGNDNVGSVHMPLRVADSIAALADDRGGRAREIDLLNRRTRKDRTAEGRVIAGCYWAPELHEIGGRLTILFAPCFNPGNDQSNDGGVWSTVESHMMQLRDGGDPAVPADWSKPAAVRKADGSPLGRPGFPKNISLDMSYFEAGGQGYYTWSQRYLPASGPLGDPLTWIAKVDPSSPTRLASDPRPIIVPGLSFEENLSEGAFALFHNGRVHLIYSSARVGPTYLVGGVWADARSDLTDIASWHKYAAPLQKSVPMPAGVTDHRTYEQGPGHGAFTTDPDGNTVYAYHSWGNGVGGNGRDAKVRRIHWAADGRPILDMTADEEVAPANQSVMMAVTVTEKRNPAMGR